MLLFAKQDAWRPKQAGSLFSDRERAIDAREHFFFSENL
jgi:hypothetical protein